MARISDATIRSIADKYVGRSMTHARRQGSLNRLHGLLGLRLAGTDDVLHLDDDEGRRILTGAHLRNSDVGPLRDHLEERLKSNDAPSVTGNAVRDAGMDLLHDAGMDPEMSHAVAKILGQMQWLDDQGLMIAIERAKGRMRVVRMLDPTLFWIEGQLTMIGTRLTETHRSAYVGGPLRSLVSHPVIDRHDIVISSIETVGMTGTAVTSTIVHFA